MIETTRCSQSQAELALFDHDNNLEEAVNYIIENQNNTDSAIVGGVAGGAAGAMAGSLVDDTTLVPGVLIGYAENGKIFTSAQVGRPCEFKVGEISLMVMTISNETRIQPNASCPEPAKG